MDDAIPARHDAARQAAVRKETMIAAVMNVVLGLVFFLLIFGWNRSATVSVALDFLPQTMGMTFLGGMVASMICLSKVGKGTLVPAGPVPTRRHQAIRVFGGAVAATLVFGGLAALIVAAVAPPELSPGMAVAMKSVYGIAMAFVTTPPIVRMAFGMPFRSPTRAARIAAARS